MQKEVLKLGKEFIVSNFLFLSLDLSKWNLERQKEV